MKESYNQSVPSSNVDSEFPISVELRWVVKPGHKVAAFATARIAFETGDLTVHGFSIVDDNGKPPWVGFPQKSGRMDGKYFPVFEATGEWRQRIIDAILLAYQDPKNKATNL
jgi:hypothetical protein